jgi:hypothetical protein
MDNYTPQPTVMPIDRDKWYKQLNLSNFINSYYQYRDVQQCGNPERILIVGPGQGLDAQILRWRGYDITTLDIDDTFNPDVIGSVHDLSMFDDKQFDIVIASHVLEHIAVPYLDTALNELARVGRWTIIYLPVAGRHSQIRLIPGLKGLDLTAILDFFNILEKPDGVTPKYCGGQHFWEVGYRGFRVKELISRFEKSFRVMNHYRNKDWNPSYNFVLQSNRYS